jgi:hypothetical protein
LTGVTAGAKEMIKNIGVGTRITQTEEMNSVQETAATQQREPTEVQNLPKINPRNTSIAAEHQMSSIAIRTQLDQELANQSTRITASEAACSTFPPVGPIIGAQVAQVAAIVAMIKEIDSKATEDEAAQKEHDAADSAELDSNSIRSNSIFKLDP